MYEQPAGDFFPVSFRECRVRVPAGSRQLVFWHSCLLRKWLCKILQILFGKGSEGGKRGRKGWADTGLRTSRAFQLLICMFHLVRQKKYRPQTKRIKQKGQLHLWNDSLFFFFFFLNCNNWKDVCGINDMICEINHILQRFQVQSWTNVAAWDILKDGFLFCIIQCWSRYFHSASGEWTAPCDLQNSKPYASAAIGA